MNRADTPLDPRSPLILDVRELGRRPGQMQELHRQVPAPEHMGTDVIQVAAGSPIDLDLRLESVVEGVLVSGTARATATGACVRCLEPVELAIDVPFQDLYEYADRAAHHHEVGAEDDEEVHQLDGDYADLEPVLRDAVVPALPFQPVCQPDCPGLCSQCGARLADDPAHHHELIDPRWAALADLAGDGTEDHSDEKRN